MDKEILKDHEGRPIAVKIAYADWLEIEQRMDLQRIVDEAPVIDMERFRGTLPKTIDPDAYQEQMRQEWE